MLLALSRAFSTDARGGGGTPRVRRDDRQHGAGHGVDGHLRGTSVETTWLTEGGARLWTRGGAGVCTPKGFQLWLFWPAAAGGAPGVGEQGGGPRGITATVRAAVGVICCYDHH